MKNKIFLYTALLGLAATASSTAEEGFYAGLIGGANWVDRSNHHCHNGDQEFNLHGNSDAGYLVGCDFGWTWCNDFSVEGEFVYRHNDLRHVKRHHKHGKGWVASTDGVDGTATRSGKRHHDRGHGFLESYSLMVNGRYDICIDCCFTPYVKGGIGWARTKFHASRSHHKGSATASTTCDWSDQKWKHHKTKSGFAWQVGAGVAFPIWDCTILDLGYNYLRAEKDINNNSFMATLRYMF